MVATFTNTGHVFFASFIVLLRRSYSYNHVIIIVVSSVREDRQRPDERTNALVRMATKYTKHIRGPFLGHKFVPQPVRWPDFDFIRYCVSELMHDSKVFCEMVVKCLIGKGPCGTSYHNWNKDDKHRTQARILGIFESIWPGNDGPLPWRLTREQLLFLDKRMSRVLWPHYVERLYYKGYSFWLRPSRMWKARRKYRLLYFMLVTQLRDQVPAFKHALETFVWGMRRLEGQVFSYEDAVSPAINILPGSRAVKKDQFDDIKYDIALGLAMMEGSFPVGQLNPAMKHFCHYVKYTMSHGPLRAFWMMAFERYNKHLKGLIENHHHTEINLAKSCARDSTARFINIKEGVSDFQNRINHPRQPHNCVLWGRMTAWVPTEEEVAGLAFQGLHFDLLSVKTCSIAYILNVHFKAGEWDSEGRWCGSVITCVLDGRSLYARVNRFLFVVGSNCPGYASVSWFGVPSYPSQTPLIVTVNADGDDLHRQYGCIVRITQIQPSRIMVELPDTDDVYYMMRDSGYDITTST